jgi:hypothetical protein
MKKSFKKIIGFSIALTCVVSSCDNSNNTRNNAESNSENIVALDKSSKVELKVGGLYLLKNEDSSYYVSKILAIDNFALHLRTYSNKFTKRPDQINSAVLDILIGHAPLDKDGFLISAPELLKVEEVKDSELEGYKLYLEEMKKSTR